MSKPVPVALCGATLDKELAAVKAAWDALQRLDMNARDRAIEWLRSWSDDERRASGSGEDF